LPAEGEKVGDEMVDGDEAGDDIVPVAVEQLGRGGVPELWSLSSSLLSSVSDKRWLASMTAFDDLRLLSAMDKSWNKVLFI